MRLDGAPVFRVGPHLVFAEIAKERIHGSELSAMFANLA
jgi:hypothetical protein